VVAVPARAWRPYAAPAAFLAAVTLAVVGARVLWPHHPARTQQRASPRLAQPTHAKASKSRAGARFYRVRAGDTLAVIAARTKTPVDRLRRLNPAVEPTALFIGQRLRLR
jgi:Tfp pilus assembly protein FimV